MPTSLNLSLDISLHKVLHSLIVEVVDAIDKEICLQVIVTRYSEFFSSLSTPSK